VFVGTILHHTDTAYYRHGSGGCMGHFIGKHVCPDIRSDPPVTKASEPLSTAIKFGVLSSDCRSDFTCSEGRAKWASRLGPADPRKGEFGERFPSIMQASFALQQCRPDDNPGTTNNKHDVGAVKYTAVPLTKASRDTVELLTENGIVPRKGEAVPANWRDVIWVTSPDGYRSPVVIANFVTITRPAEPTLISLAPGSRLSFEKIGFSKGNSKGDAVKEVDIIVVEDNTDPNLTTKGPRGKEQPIGSSSPSVAAQEVALATGSGKVVVAVPEPPPPSS
jgi:hypothetical protein